MRRWKGDEVTGFNSADVDIRNGGDVLSAVRSCKPDCVVLSAAYTNVDGCESNRDLAFAVNTDGAANVARAALKQGAHLLFLSTDYVFDGTKMSPYEIDDAHNPQTVYGLSKSRAETLLQETIPQCCIVRTSWLFGTNGRCFPDTILKVAAQQPEIEVVNDQVGCPTSTNDLADVLIQLARQQARGIVHVTNNGACSWFDFAREIVRGSGMKTSVRPTSSETLSRPARRPKYSVLSSSSLGPYQIVMPSWQNALGRYLEERLCTA
jgi:dTDP-4-dehydrorhamnose reductase